MDHPTFRKEPEKISADKVVPKEKHGGVDCIRKDIHPKKDGSEEKMIGTISKGISSH